jgi:hypothetical protein
MKPWEIHRSFLGRSEYGIDRLYSETPSELRISCNQKRDDVHHCFSTGQSTGEV